LFPRPRKGLAGLGETLQHGIRVGQHGPALQIAFLRRGLAFQPLGQAVDHGLDLRQRDLAFGCCGCDSLDRLRPTQRRVQQHGEHRNGQAHDKRSAGGAARRRCGDVLAGGLLLVERPTFDVGPAELVLLGVDGARGKVRLDGGQLVTQHLQVGAARIHCRHRA
jgi:hypothetical protein